MLNKETLKQNEQICDIQINSYQEALAEAKKDKENFEALLELNGNEDWITFRKAYLVDERDRLSRALTSPSTLKDETIKQLQEKQDGLRHFSMFIRKVENRVVGSEETIKGLEAELEMYLNGTRLEELNAQCEEDMKSTRGKE